ncbi:Cytochrome p450 [Thalictrum thalictroides]|uniref:Cytochrome p450 n=1 Tax=Thalictrum thalictroides TaxID=46969 RepID=A0A7J6VYJ9_THATH|nr:Cytochrome p450 [Thalictrum thalictroides]
MIDCIRKGKIINMMTPKLSNSMADLVRLLLQWLGMEDHQQTLLLFHYPLLLLFIILLFIFSFSIIFRQEKLNLPPSPPKIPIIGNLHQLSMDLHLAIHNLSQKHGPLMMLSLGYCQTLVVSSAEMVREIKLHQEIPFADRPVTTAVKMLNYGGINLFFSPYGEYWRQVRKIYVMELLSSKRVQSFKCSREDEVALMINKISLSCSVGASVNIRELVTRLTMDIVCRCAFGRIHQGQDGHAHFGDLVDETVKLFTAFSFGDLFPWLGWMDILTGLIGRIKKVSRKIDNYIDQIIDQHLIQSEHSNSDCNKDFVDILLDVQKNDTSFTRDNIKAFILDNLAAGTETTSTTIEWAFAELIKNPTMMKKVQEEVRRVVGTKGKVDEEDLHQMEYLKLVVKETLRLHPAGVLILGQSSTITNVKGYHIPAKTQVLINVWSVHRDPQQWDKPDKFIPERFLNNPIDFKGQDFKYIPFGSGRRGCPGISFGIAVVEIAIANLLYWFDWKMPSGEDLDMREGFGLSVNKKIPLELVPISHFSA